MENLFSESAGLLKPMTQAEIDRVELDKIEENRSIVIESLKKNRKLIDGKWEYNGDLNLEYLSINRLDDILKDYPVDIVNGFLRISGNPLTSLNGIPSVVNDSISISDLPLKSLRCDYKIKTNWIYFDNLKIINFKDFPFINLNQLNIVVSSILSLESLEGLPKECGILEINNCNNLRTLYGCPEKIEEFSVSFCDKLMTLDGIAKKIDICSFGNLPALIDLNGLENSDINVIQQFFQPNTKNSFSRHDLPYKVRTSANLIGVWKKV